MNNDRCEYTSCPNATLCFHPIIWCHFRFKLECAITHNSLSNSKIKICVCTFNLTDNVTGRFSMLVECMGKY